VATELIGKINGVANPHYLRYSKEITHILKDSDPGIISNP
jgi:hypothetical protein